MHLLHLAARNLNDTHCVVLVDPSNKRRLCASAAASQQELDVFSHLRPRKWKSSGLRCTFAGPLR